MGGTRRGRQVSCGDREGMEKRENREAGSARAGVWRVGVTVRSSPSGSLWG